jgi:arginyl-tRNA synthetase
MGLAKKLKSKPRDIAQRLVEIAEKMPEIQAMCEPLEIAGPGFINIRLRNDWLADLLNETPPAGENDRLGIEPTPVPKTVVVDYSGPNIAKQMHVGHLRSTVIGDTLARTLAFEGHHVIRQNHIGDWGTQFGMLIAHLKDNMPEAIHGQSNVHLEDLEAFYRQANQRDKEDPAFKEKARAEVVALHNHDPETLQAWRYIVDESRNHYMPVYQRLNVSLTRDDERGESFYAEKLPEIVADLEKQFAGDQPKSMGAPNSPRITVEESDGALCVFHANADDDPIFKNKEGKRFPMIIRKSDGAFLYATTDLAALRFRILELDADRVIYVTDARQAQHFQMVFATAEATGWVDAHGDRGPVELEHVAFGSILGEDHKPLKTRSGDNIKLAELLDEAVSRAEKLIRTNEQDPAKKRGFSDDEVREIAEAVGIGAVKYADMSQNRLSDYVFSWDKMLAMEGNTAPYMMYAYARIRSIYRKGADEGTDVSAGRILLDADAERVLARQILRFGETLENVSSTLKLNLLTDYLFDLAGSFMRFYEACPVLKADSPEQRSSRLKLCDLTARTLKAGLGLMGIQVVQRM